MAWSKGEEALTLIATGVCLAGTTINVTMDAIKAQRTGAEVAIRRGVGVVAHAAVLARLQNVTFGSGSVAVGTDAR